jgi:hypothetical protein
MSGKETRDERDGADAEGDIHGVQGEGNREADRRYRKGAKRFVESGRVDGAAREAVESLDADARAPKAPSRGDERDREK